MEPFRVLTELIRLHTGLTTSEVRWMDSFSKWFYCACMHPSITLILCDFRSESKATQRLHQADSAHEDRSENLRVTRNAAKRCERWVSCHGCMRWIARVSHIHSVLYYHRQKLSACLNDWLEMCFELRLNQSRLAVFSSFAQVQYMLLSSEPLGFSFLSSSARFEFISISIWTRAFCICV